MTRPVILLAILQLAFSELAVAEDAIWTNRPVRVDPTKQNFERLPSLVLGLEGAETISFPLRIDMHDSASFSANGTEFRLKGLRAVAADRLCRSQTGARWPCGAQASIFVSNLFRGRTLVCRVEPKPDHVQLSGCRTTGMRIPQEIVGQGFAFPAAGDSDLEAALISARLRRAGVWKDAACAEALHSC